MPFRTAAARIAAARTAVTSAVVAVLAVAGCSGGSPVPVPVVPELDRGPAALSVVHWRPADAAAWTTVVERFEEEYPDIDVEVSTYTAEPGGATVPARIREGRAGDVLAAESGPLFEALVAEDVLVDLAMRDHAGRYAEGPLSAGRRGDGQYGLPYQLVLRMVVADADALARLGIAVPADFAGLLAACRAARAGGTPLLAYPADGGGLLDLLVANNAPAASSLGQVQTGGAALTDEWFVRTLGQARELADAGCFAADPATLSTAAAVTLVARGEAVALVTGTQDLAALRAERPAFRPALLAPVTVEPARARYVGVYTAEVMLGVNARSPLQDEADTFVEFLSRPEVAAEYAAVVGRHVTVRDVTYSDPVLRETASWAARSLAPAPTTAVTDPGTLRAIGSALAAALAGSSPAEAAATAQAALDRYP